MSIEVQDLTKRFGDFTAVDHVNLHVETGSLVAILGPSGSGKSTLLRMIAGLETPDEGVIRLIGREATHISVQKRNVGFVFQHYALFKHMTVWDNIAFGLQIRHVPRKEIEKRVAELVDLVLLTGMEKRYPKQLSGGQRQRVALARALAPRPDVMLLDEPFGALDAKVREELRLWIRRLHDQTRVTTIFVTHDQHEALEIAHQVLVMDRGKIIQVGSPRDIFDKPATPFVAEFVGESNHLDAEVSRDGKAVWGPFQFPANGRSEGEHLRIYFRPHDVYLSSQPQTGLAPGWIRRSSFRGALTELEIVLEGNKEILAHVPKGVAQSSGFVDGKNVHVAITAYHVFSGDGSSAPPNHVGFEGMNI